jgi:3-keto-5-aminohexanoate cleavage enzyme
VSSNAKPQVDFMDKVIITVALNGSVPTKEMNPHVPLTPDELTQAAVRCREAGASLVHVHARDAQGQPTLAAEVFAQIHAAICAESDVIVQISTGARAGTDVEERAAAVRSIGPEMASLTTGSMNFPDQVYANSFAVIERLAAVMKEAGTKPEMEIFEAGMIDNALALAANGLAEAPLHFDFVLGSRGSQPATARQLLGCGVGARAAADGHTGHWHGWARARRSRGQSLLSISRASQ